MGNVRSIRAAATSENGVELWLVSEINSWTAQDFIWAADCYGKEKSYTLNIYSPGGDPFAAFAIHDYIKASGMKATARVWGHAASAAAIIACSCDRVEMGENSFMMIHNAYGGDDQSLLDSINEKQVALFKKKTGMSASKVSALMEAETWMDAKEAKANGFADAIIKELAIAALYKAQYMEEQKKPETPEVTDVTEVVKQADPGDEQPEADEVEVEVPVSTADAVMAAVSGKIKAKVPVNKELRAAMTTAIEEAKEVKAQLQERVDEVTSLQEKLTKAQAEASDASEAKANAEAQLATMSAKMEEIKAEVEKLKKAPLAEAEKQPKAETIVVPGKMTETATTNGVSQRTMEVRQRANEVMDRVNQRKK